MAEHIDARPVNAYILVKTEPEAADVMARRLAKRLSDASVRRVTGRYDIVVALEADGQEYITRALHDQVRPVDGVIDAEALVWYEEGPTAPAHGQPLHRTDEEAA